MPEHRVDLLQLAHLDQHALFLQQRIGNVLFAEFLEHLRKLDTVSQRRDCRLLPPHDVAVELERLDLVDKLLLGRQELVHWRVKQAHGHRVGRHD